MRPTQRPGTSLPPGVILAIAQAAGVETTQGPGTKTALRCPFHDDRRPSAVLFSETNAFHCSVCGNLNAKEFARRLGERWPPPDLPRRQPPAPGRSKESAFTATDGQRVWNRTLARARADDGAVITEDKPVYDFLKRRWLQETWEFGLFGTLGPTANTKLPEAIRGWGPAGFRLVAPLYDRHGRVANVQARQVKESGTGPKVLFPKGSSATGLVFADAPGIEVLRGTWERNRVLLAEGLTDFLALSLASPIPVLSIPGTGTARTAFGPWARGKTIYLAFDMDAAGDGATRQAALQATGAKALKRLRWLEGCEDACDVVERYDGGITALASFLDQVLGREEARK